MERRMEDLRAINGGKGLKDFEKAMDGNRPNFANWRKLFAASADQALSYVHLQSLNGKVQIPMDVLEGELKWKNAVVAQFVGRIPNFSAFQKLVNI